MSFTCMHAVPAAAPSVTEPEATSRSVSIFWEELSPEDHNGVITGYTVTISDLDDLSGSTEYSLFTEFLNITIPDLSPYTTYGVLVTAHTEVGPGPSSDLHTIQTKEEGCDSLYIRPHALSIVVIIREFFCSVLTKFKLCTGKVMRTHNDMCVYDNLSYTHVGACCY